MRHECSPTDLAFRARFEAGDVAPADFNHRAHIRLAYTHLCGEDAETAHRRVSDALLRFLDHHAIDRAKYHETLTRAWILAVRHFMNRTPHSDSADAFIDQNPVLLDSKIMLTHYSADRLFSAEARARFVGPDLDPIPTLDGSRHGHDGTPAAHGP